MGEATEMGILIPETREFFVIQKPHGEGCWHTFIDPKGDLHVSWLPGGKK